MAHDMHTKRRRRRLKTKYSAEKQHTVYTQCGRESAEENYRGVRSGVPKAARSIGVEGGENIEVVSPSPAN